MSTPSLTSPQPPWVVITRTGDPWLTAETTKLQDQGGAVVRLNGPELTDKQSLFTAFARELSFPAHFGHNWDALTDCLRDWPGPAPATGPVTGHAGPGAAVLIDHADPLTGTDYFGLLIAVLTSGAGPRPAPGGEPFGLHFVLLLDDTEPASLAGPAATDPDVTTTVTDGRLTATLAQPTP